MRTIDPENDFIMKNYEKYTIDNFTFRTEQGLYCKIFKSNYFKTTIFSKDENGIIRTMEEILETEKRLYATSVKYNELKNICESLIIELDSIDNNKHIRTNDFENKRILLTKHDQELYFLSKDMKEIRETLEKKLLEQTELAFFELKKFYVSKKDLSSENLEQTIEDKLKLAIKDKNINTIKELIDYLGITRSRYYRTLEKNKKLENLNNQFKDKNLNLNKCIKYIEQNKHNIKSLKDIYNNCNITRQTLHLYREQSQILENLIQQYVK